MRSLLADVMDLQADWSGVNTEEMQLRGTIVRHELPSWIRENLSRVVDPKLGMAVEGQDGVGRKSRVPWVRIYSPAESPSPTSGWYVVYLFSADSDSCYLSLSHGSTQWDGGSLVPRTAEEMSALMGWARTTLGTLPDPRLSPVVDLGVPKGSLGYAYQGTIVTALQYRRDALPSTEELLEDLRMMTQLLLRLYGADRRDPLVPGRLPPEVALVTEEIDRIVSPRPKAGGGQGFRLTKAEQVAVERHAVSAATRYLEGFGWDVRDVGATKSYDLHCRRGEEALHVEVKGTTSAGATVVLTRNEVAFHRETYPTNALIVVSRIQLDRGAEQPVASGGEVEVTMPWRIDEDALQPIAYTYNRSAHVRSSAMSDTSGRTGPGETTAVELDFDAESVHT